MTTELRRPPLRQIVPVLLPALEHGAPPGARPKERHEFQMANKRRRCWRITLPDGTPTRTGLFEHYQLALSYAQEQGWRVVTPENAHGGTN